jgi:hypothetical protein
MARAESRTARNMADVPDMIVSNDCLVVVREVADSFGLSSPGMHIDWDLATPFFSRQQVVGADGEALGLRWMQYEEGGKQ